MLNELAPSTDPDAVAVLFVDDEPMVLQGLERMLRPLRGEWRLRFVNSGAEALQLMDAHPFDIIVTDMRMPSMNGAALLEAVRERQPRVTRIALSGEAEPDLMLRAMGLAHQYLTKPCDGAVLREKLVQASQIRTLIHSPRLQAIISPIVSLRSVPSVYAELMAEVQSRDPSPFRIGNIIAKDPAITAKTLQLINSAFFSVRGRVTDPHRAVQLLGLDTIKAIVLSTEVFSRFERRAGLNPVDVWEHSMRTADLAMQVARRLRLDPNAIHEAFTAGLLHDVGKLVLADTCPAYETLLTTSTDGRSAVETEGWAFGANHAEVGGYLFGLWGLPYGIVEAVAWHHDPSSSGARRPCALTAVHVANVLDYESRGAAGVSTLDGPYLESLGLTLTNDELKVAVH